MSWHTLRSALDLLLASRLRNVTLSFYGGEPLLRFDLIRRAVEYAEARGRRWPRVTYAIVTNGMLLRGAALDFVAQHRFSTQISFDGVAAMQELRCPGTYRRLDQLLELLAAEYPDFFRKDVSVAVTLTSKAIPHLAASIRYFLSKGVQEIGLAPLVTHDPDWKPELIEALDRQFGKIYRAALRHYGNTGEVPLLLYRSKRKSGNHAPRGSRMCRVGSGKSLTVDADGEVHGCVAFAGSYQRFATAFLRDRVDAMRMGPVTSPRLRRRLAAYPAAVKAAQIFDDRRNKYSSFRRCGDCRYQESCSICPISIGHIPGNRDPSRVPDHACAFNLVAGKWRSRFFRQLDPLEIVRGRAPLPAFMKRLRANVAAAQAARASAE